MNNKIICTEKLFYTYKISNTLTGEFYIGARGCFCNPELDKYKGSMVTWKRPEFIYFKKEILNIFHNIIDANKDEKSLILKYYNHPLNRNKGMGGNMYRGTPYTTQEFIKKSIQIHKNLYDYSLVSYKNAHTRVEIICKTHGVFTQAPVKHLSGSGCNICGFNKPALIKKKKAKEGFIDKCFNKHGDRYDYSLVEYITSIIKVKIICKTHGFFYQKPTEHLSGKGCRKCGNNSLSIMKSSNTFEFINKSSVIHKDLYDYSLVDYTGANKKVKIICKTHGVFEQNAYTHLDGRGCRKCGYKSQGIVKSSNTSEFIVKSNIKHNNLYDYSLVDYTGANKKVKIICKTHGVFEQNVSSHLKGYGCSKCK